MMMIRSTIAHSLGAWSRGAPRGVILAFRTNSRSTNQEKVCLFNSARSPGVSRAYTSPAAAEASTGEQYSEKRFRPRAPGSFRPPSRPDDNFNSGTRSSSRSGLPRFGDGNRGSDGRSLGPRKFEIQRLEKVSWEAEQLAPITKNFYKERPEVARRTVAEIQAILQENEIAIKGSPPIPKPVNSFAEAGFPHSITAAFEAAQYSAPTAIQKIGFPIALSGRDFVGISKTGSGKTVAFLAPAITHIQAQPPVHSGDGPIVLVLAPTRELVAQTLTEAGNLGRASGIRATGVYGGANRGIQATALRRGAEIIVACPGRLIDFLSAGELNLKRTTFLILDEADRMMDMGFEPQIRSIVSQIRPDRQTLMYSATWPLDVQSLARDFCKEDPVEVRIGSQELHANPDVQQSFAVVPMRDKQDHFVSFVANSIRQQPTSKILVFTRTRAATERLQDPLMAAGIRASTIHGGKPQASRDSVVNQFRSGSIPVLVATDVAARGLDISDVSTVINFDLPDSPESYVHRIGRTGRAGKKGASLTYLAQEDRSSEVMRLVRGISRLLTLANQPIPHELRSMGA